MKLIPLAHDSKQPLAGADWHDRISDDSTEQADWRARGLNVGLPVEENGRVVVDFDDKAAGHAFMKNHPELCTVVVDTKRGLHFHFSGKTQTRKLVLDGQVLGDVKGNGYVLWIGSVVRGHVYRLLREGELQPFPEALFPPMVSTRNGVASLTREPIRMLKNYVMKIESRQGQNGSAGLVRFCSICRDHDLSQAQTMLWLLEWNKTSKVEPPWSEDELARAVTRSFEK